MAALLPQRLLRAAARLVGARANAVAYSVASLWEVSFKSSLGRLLVAQATIEGHKLWTADAALRRHGTMVKAVA